MTLDTSNQQDYKPGTVISAQANFYQVRLDSGDTLLCVRPTRLKKIGQSVLVGDRVLVKASDAERGLLLKYYQELQFWNAPYGQRPAGFLGLLPTRPSPGAYSIESFSGQGRVHPFKPVVGPKQDRFGGGGRDRKMATNPPFLGL